MAREFDPEQFRPDDLEAERLYDQDPEFRRLWVEKCEAERAFRRIADSTPPTREYVAVVERLKRAREQLRDYSRRKGLRDPDA